MEGMTEFVEEGGQHWVKVDELGGLMAFCREPDGNNTALYRAARSREDQSEFHCPRHGRVLAEFQADTGGYVVTSAAVN